MTIRDSQFLGNTAAASGGGLYFGGSDQDVNVAPVLFNCLIRGNNAGRDGGGVSVNWYNEPIISNCTIVDNFVSGAFESALGGGLYVSYDANAVMTDSILWGNTSNYHGSQIAVASGNPYGARPSTLSVTYSDIQPDRDPNEAPKPLDLVFLIDSTGSMFDDINAVRASADGDHGPDCRDASGLSCGRRGLSRFQRGPVRRDHGLSVPRQNAVYRGAPGT